MESLNGHVKKRAEDAAYANGGLKGAGVAGRDGQARSARSPLRKSGFPGRLFEGQQKGACKAVGLFISALLTISTFVWIGYQAGQRSVTPQNAASAMRNGGESQETATASLAAWGSPAVPPEKSATKAAPAGMAAMQRAKGGDATPPVAPPPLRAQQPEEVSAAPGKATSAVASSPDARLQRVFDLFARNERAGIHRMDTFYKGTLSEAQRNECLGFFQMHNLSRSRFTGQCFQDFWLWQFVIGPLLQQNRIDQDHFTYIDIGAHHYKTISNIYFFDKCLGFRGVCAEPLEIYQDKLRTERRCELLTTCASDKVETVKFGVSSNLGKSGRVDEAHPGELTGEGNTFVEMECRPLREPIKRAKIDRVLIMSLDVEGAELKVFRGVSPYPVGLVMVENPGNRTVSDNLVEEFRKEGYWHFQLGSQWNNISPLRPELLFVHDSFPMSKDELLDIDVQCGCAGCDLIESRYQRAH